MALRENRCGRAGSDSEPSLRHLVVGLRVSPPPPPGTSTRESRNAAGSGSWRHAVHMRRTPGRTRYRPTPPDPHCSTPKTSLQARDPTTNQAPLEQTAQKSMNQLAASPQARPITATSLECTTCESLGSSFQLARDHMTSAAIADPAPCGRSVKAAACCAPRVID